MIGSAPLLSLWFAGFWVDLFLLFVWVLLFVVFSMVGTTIVLSRSPEHSCTAIRSDHAAFSPPNSTHLEKLEIPCFLGARARRSTKPSFSPSRFASTSGRSPIRRAPCPNGFYCREDFHQRPALASALMAANASSSANRRFPHRRPARRRLSPREREFVNYLDSTAREICIEIIEDTHDTAPRQTDAGHYPSLHFDYGCPPSATSYLDCSGFALRPPGQRP